MLAWARPAAAGDDLAAHIDRIVTGVLASETGAGAAVAVIRKGRVLVKKGYGAADVELSVPMSERNVFCIASITKQFTAAAIMLLVERGKLALEDDVGALLPDAPMQGKHITVAQLLSHTSGIRNFVDLPDVHRELPLPPALLFALLRDRPTELEPGRSWRYSSTNYYLAALIIEKVSGRSYRDFLRDEVLARAGLAHTLVCDHDAIIPGRATGYTYDGPQLKKAMPIDMSSAFGTGSLCSTVDDLVTWSQALASGKVVSAATYAKMTTPVKTADGKAPPYGFGLDLEPYEGHRAVWHSGRLSGFAGMLLRFPDDDVTVVVLGNSDGFFVPTATRLIVDAVFGLAPQPELARPLTDPAPFVGTFRVAGKGVPRLMHVYAEAGRLWLSDEADPRGGRLDYQGGDEFVIAHSPVRVHITPEAIECRFPDGTKLAGPRQK
jgi:CubicO group peptidase (beta-lactamase class C family)